MGIYGALNNAVSGLQAQSFALEQISGNIANSQTVGYKRSETSFVDMINESTSTQQAPGGVSASTRATNDVQGALQMSSVETFMAISGDGYFVVSQALGELDGELNFDTTDVYTRRGDFQLDRNGYLVNGSGYFLQGLEIDPATGNAAGSVPGPVRIENDFLPAQATSQINYELNLARFPLTSRADPAIPGSELLDPTQFQNDPTVVPATATDGFIRGDDVTVFLESSIAGGATTVYDAAGAPVNVQFRWAKIDSAASGGVDSWQLYYLSDSTATGAAPAWRNTGSTYTFAADGTLTAPTTDPTINFNVGGSVVSNVRLRHDTTGVTQFSDPSGNAQLTDLSQNGFAAGELVGVAVSESGRLVATYANGQVADVAEVAVVTFNGDSALKKLDGGAFQATRESGDAILVDASGVTGGALEMSNVDISDEFTKLIVTQQAYSASTRIVTVSDEMMQEALGMVR
ncbi:MAG: flagellar hook-basal body complex protein [Pseudomonadota bacterium]